MLISKKIIRYCGILTLMLGVYMLIPLLSLLFYPDEANYAKYFLIPAVIIILLGFLVVKYYERDFELELDFKEASMITVGIWIIAVLAGALPFVLSNHLPLIDALFESMSGWSTTGLTMVSESETPKMFLFWRSFMQYIGGLGFVVLVMSSLVGTNSFNLYEAEGRTDRLMPNLTDTTKLIVKIYLFYTVLGIILYLIAGMNLFDAINHSMTALSTGGFSTREASIGYWNSSAVNLVTIILMLLGTISFVIHYNVLVKKKKKVINDGELKLLLSMISISVILIVLLVRIWDGFIVGVGNIIFQVISALSTAGLGTVDLNGWHPAALLILVILMIIGGGMGATAGGLKQERVVILFKSMIYNIRKELYNENVVLPHWIYLRGEKKKIADDYLVKIAGYTSLYLFTFLIGSFIFIAHGYSVIEALFEYASTLSTIGLSVGITGPEMPNLLKGLQIITMWLGRLEFIALIIFVVKFKDWLKSD